MERTIALIKKSHEGDKRAKEQLVEENIGLIWCVVKRFYNRGVEPEDLFQIGSIGLLKAIDKFDLGYGVKFSTYAVPMIAGEIKRFLRDDGMIKVSRSLKENHWKIQQAMQTIQKQNGKEVTVREIMEATGLSEDEVVMAMDVPMEVESLSKPVGTGEGKEAPLENWIPVTFDEKKQVDNRVVLEQLLSNLNAKERQLIYMRYFQDCTQTTVAEKLQMSQVQVSRLEKKILHMMREQMGEV